MQLNQIFTSHMVFPANKVLRVYGISGTDVTVNFAGQQVTVSPRDRKWIAEFPPMEYGGPYEMTVTSGIEHITLDDIYIGEVYLCSGQSNMTFQLQLSTYPKESYADNPMLRLFSTDRLEAGEPLKAKDGWRLCEKETAGLWSALGYLVGMDQQRRKNIAIGIITCAQGASVIESWVPKGTFENIGIRIPMAEKWFDHKCPAYCWRFDGRLYEFALSQVIPYPLSAVIWYQGEADSTAAEGPVYDRELCELIRIWRDDFRDSGLPFVVVQLARLIDWPDQAGWKLVQEAQTRVPTMIPGVKTVVSADVCETDDIHPPTKDKLAIRISDALDNLL